MTYAPRRIAFLGREGRVEHYGIARRFFSAPKHDPGALAEMQDTGLASLEVIDFERRAWLRDVLEDGDLDAYLSRAPEEALV